MSGLTPGPWTVVSDIHNGRIGICSERGVVVFAPMTVGHKYKAGVQGTENARLLAAAPDLLAACVEFVRKCDSGEARSTRSYAQMKAAIAKATGTAPANRDEPTQDTTGVVPNYAALVAERDALRKALEGVVAAWVNPGDGQPFEAGEVPALDDASAALKSCS